MPSDAYTLPQLSRALEVHYRTLHSWVEKGLLHPSVRRSGGTGTPNLFDRRDATTAFVLRDLREAGVSLQTMQKAADRLREVDGALDRQAFVLVNGDVKVVFETEAVANALHSGGLTLTYNTSDALRAGTCVVEQSKQTSITPEDGVEPALSQL